MPVSDATSAAVLVTPKLFEAILAAQKNLLFVSTPDAALALAQLRQLAMRSGQAIYAWESDDGIVPMRDGGARIASTQRFGDAIRHVQRSPHFGIYVFVGVAGKLLAGDIEGLVSIAENDGPAARKVVFLGPSFKTPDALIGLSEFMRCNDPVHTTLRLRDGNWTQT